MKNKTNKNYYLQKETIIKLEQLSKSNNFKNPSNYLDELIAKLDKNNKTLGQTEKEMLAHLIQNSITKEIFGEVWKANIELNKTINEKLQRLENKIDLTGADISSPINIDSKMRDEYLKLSQDNQYLLATVKKQHQELERFGKLEKQLSSVDSIENELIEIKRAMRIYRLILNNLSRISDTELNELDSIKDNSVYFTEARDLLKAKNLTPTDVGLVDIQSHFRRKIKEEINKKRGQK